MANEAVFVEPDWDSVVRYTIADGQDVSKGTLLKLVDPRTVSAGNITKGAAFAGILAEEKKANDGVVSVPVLKRGLFDLTHSSVVTSSVGAILEMSGANLVATATEANIAAGGAVGKAEEAAGASEVFLVRVGSMF